MNNGAFQRLVRDKAGINKTSKEIAREAVEAEFKGGGNKRKRDAYYSSDDGGGHSDTERRKSRRVGRPNETMTPKEPSELDLLAGKYRDRALERREGGKAYTTPVPTTKSAADQIFDDVVEAFESGDRRKLTQIRVLEADYFAISRPPKTSDETLAWIASPITSPATALGKNMLEYLRQQHLPSDPTTIAVTAAGRHVQRSELTFSVSTADPRDQRRSWERPLEQTFASANADLAAKMTPCHDELLQQIQRCLDMHHKSEEAKRKAVDAQAVVPAAIGRNTDDDDDEDIFERAGDYDGAAVSAVTDVRGDGANSEPSGPEIESNIAFIKGSIFGSKRPVANNGESPGGQFGARAINGAMPVLSSIPLALVGLSSLQSGYCDDGIVLDFDGHGYDDDDDENDEVKALSKKKKPKSRRERRAERSPS